LVWKRRRRAVPQPVVRDDLAELRRIADEAVLVQGLAEDILDAVRGRRSLAEIARPGGVLTTRLCTLRAEVPEPADPRLRAAAQTLRETLHHHALFLSCALDLLGDLRPERVQDQIDQIDGFGAPGERLRALRDQLRTGPRPHASSAPSAPAAPRAP
jgi:hypothetical protein